MADGARARDVGCGRGERVDVVDDERSARMMFWPRARPRRRRPRSPKRDGAGTVLVVRGVA